MRRIVAGLLLVAGLLAGCAGGPAGEDAADTVRRLGRVPVPSAEPGPPAPVAASLGKPQLIAMGAPVRVSLPGGEAVVTTTGPDAPGGQRPGGPARGAIEITAAPGSGEVRLDAADFDVRDDSGADVPLVPDGPADVVATAGRPGALRLVGTFHDGQARIAWRQGGHVVAMWVFSVEND
ncbi:hypothetical protein GCM10025787_30690 [Saccharopolyspora rosea]|uniref:Uncharacterized protein n=1 Tax=Saccharopolyspora rosea TaxID=524884 RepID=A0ABW3FTX2_9PSEU